MERLDKYISNSTKYSRSEVKNLIKKGRVMVNEFVVKNSDTKIADLDEVKLDGVVINTKKALYFMLNKPADVISATEDDVHKTVVDLFDENIRGRIFPAGRLDIDTEGLLIITDDGELAHKITSPKKDVFKRYFAKATGKLVDNYKEIFEQGIEFKDYKTKPAKLVVDKVLDNGAEVYVEISEGKFHQVKRMLHAVGLEVTYLKRVSIGQLALDDSLEPGEYRELTSDELNYLMRI